MIKLKTPIAKLKNNERTMAVAKKAPKSRRKAGKAGKGRCK